MSMTVVDLGLPAALTPPRLGLLAVGHGTRDPAGAAVVRALVRRVGELAPDVDVRDAYVDNASPSVGHALDALAADGVGRASVVPLLLTAASHSKGDLAGSVAHEGIPLCGALVLALLTLLWIFLGTAGILGWIVCIDRGLLFA